MSPEAMLELSPPPAAARIPYGQDPNQFGELRIPRDQGPVPVVMNIHGGFWRAKYDHAHAGHLCAALAAKGVATWNVEYRRVGNLGGGWPGTLEDICSAYRFLMAEISEPYNLDPARTVVMGHSAGGHLAICLAAIEPRVRRVVSLGGVLDLRQAWELHLSNDAVVEFLGGRPDEMPDRFSHADPMSLTIGVDTLQRVIHGASDDTVPSSFSRNYSEQKRSRGEDVHYLEIPGAGHMDLIDPGSQAWPEVEATVLQQLVDR